jgi:DNA-directed RNA polymerase subunit RPC12/RpoP
MTNSKCLEGIACPQCGNDRMIYIEARTLAAVTDDGVKTFELEWNADSYAECPNCQHRGTLGEFRIAATTEPSTSTDKEKCQ